MKRIIIEYEYSDQVIRTKAFYDEGQSDEEIKQEFLKQFLDPRILVIVRKITRDELNEK